MSAEKENLKGTCTSAECARKLSDEIRAEAFAKYQWRCESREPGSEQEDWLFAERVVRARHQAATHGA